MPQGKLGPGPGAYLLPSTVGYQNHDSTRYRNPQYSMAQQYGLIDKRVSPGPKYGIGNVTRVGRHSPPAYTLSDRHKQISIFRPPGPGTYSPEAVPRMKEPRPPAYTMSSRHAHYKMFDVPAPNQYPQPSTIGPKVPNMPASAAYTMSGIHDLKPLEKSPGPAKYGETKPQIYKTKPPNYTMGIKHVDLTGKQPNPGPAGYLPKPHKCGTPGYSFGIRTINDPYIIANDNMPAAISKFIAMATP